jgi:hypothetical protein
VLSSEAVENLFPTITEPVPPQWPPRRSANALPNVRYWENSGKYILALSFSGFDPNVWSGRALQEVSSIWW